MKRSVLFLAPRLPWPLDTGGKIRTFHLLSQVAGSCSVRLACFAFSEQDRDQLSVFQKLGIEVTLVPFTQSHPLKLVKAVLNAPHPLSVEKYASALMVETLQGLIRDNNFDLVHIDHIHMAQYRPVVKDIPALIDEHNVEYRILQRCAQVDPNWVKRVLYRVQSRSMKDFEREHIHRCQSCCAVSEDDAALLSALVKDHVPIQVIPNGVDTEYFKSSDQRPAISGPKRLVFTGSMDWLPNEDAVVFFCQEVLPLVWQKEPQVAFDIVGRAPSSAVKSLARRDDRVLVTGRVDDVRKYVEPATAYVVPLRIGGGTRLKILEAMAMSKPVISTRVGAEGISCQHDKNIVLADTPQDLADSILKIMANSEFRDSLGRSGRELVLSQYDWSIVGKKMLSVYEDILQNV